MVDLGIAWIPTAHGAAEQAAFMVAAILAAAIALAIGPLVHRTLPWLAVDEPRVPGAVQSAA